MAITPIIDTRVVVGSGGDRITATTMVAGLPLVVRQLRQAARLRWQPARILCTDQAQLHDLQQVLGHWHLRAEMTVVTAEPVIAPDEVLLSGIAVYTTDSLALAARQKDAPTPLITVQDRTAIRAAQRLLERSIRKSVDLDGVVAFYFMRPLSRLMTRALLDTKVTPNQVTLVAMACGVAAALVASQGGYVAGLVAALLFWAGAAIDCVDGELARLRVSGSKMGEWLDTIADDVSTLGLLLGLGIGLTHEGAGSIWANLGMAGIVMGGLTSAKLYSDLHRLGLPIDTAQYPWFFGKPSEGVGADLERGFWSRSLYAVSFLFRRDAFVTIVSVLLACGMRRFATLILFGGAMIFVLLLVVHLLVTTVRHKRQIPQ